MNKHHRIQARAYFLWEREGGPHGRDRDYWALAEAEITAEDARQSDGTPASPRAAAAPDAPGAAPAHASAEKMRRTGADKPSNKPGPAKPQPRTKPG